MLLGNGVDPAEQGLVGACLCGDIAQVVGTAGGPTVGQEQLHAELFVQPAVEGPVPVGKGLLHGGGVGQQEIAVPAAAVNDVGPGQAAAVQQLVHVVLHEQFQKERTAAEGPQGTLGMDGVDEPLDAGKVGGVEQERRFPAQLCGSVQQGKGVGLLQVLADAGRQSCRQLELVIEGNIPVLFPRGAGRQGAALGFQQAQQRVCLRWAELQAGELPRQLLIELPVNGGGDVRRILHGVVQGTVRAGSRDGIPGVLPVQVAENGAQGPAAGAGRFGGGGVGGHRQAAGKSCAAGGVRPCGRAAAHGSPLRGVRQGGQQVGCGLVGPEGQLAKAVQQAAEGGLQGECVQGIISFGQNSKGICEKQV